MGANPEQAAVAIDTMIPGRRYQVTFDDCCIQGHFTAVFDHYNLDKNGNLDEAVFDTAFADSLWGGWTVTEVPDGEGLR